MGDEMKRPGADTPDQSTTADLNPLYPKHGGYATMCSQPSTLRPDRPLAPMIRAISPVPPADPPRRSAVEPPVSCVKPVSPVFPYSIEEEQEKESKRGASRGADDIKKSTGEIPAHPALRARSSVSDGSPVGGTGESGSGEPALGVGRTCRIPGAVRLGGMRIPRDRHRSLQDPTLEETLDAQQRDDVVIDVSEADATCVDFDLHHFTPEDRPSREAVEADLRALRSAPDAFWISHGGGGRAMYVGEGHRSRALRTAMEVPPHYGVEILPHSGRGVRRESQTRRRQ